MNDKEQPYNGQIDEALLTAFALDELEGPERALVEAALKTDPKARDALEEIRTVAGHLRDAVTHDEEFAPSTSLREMIEERLEGMTPAVVREDAALKTGPRRRRWAVFALTSAAVLLLAVTLPSVFQLGTPSEMAMDMAPMESPAPEASQMSEAGDAMAASGERGEETAEWEEAAEMASEPAPEFDADAFVGKGAGPRAPSRRAEEARPFAREGGAVAKSESAPADSEARSLDESMARPTMKGSASYKYDEPSAGIAPEAPVPAIRAQKAELSDMARSSERGGRRVADPAQLKAPAPAPAWSPNQAAGPGAIPVPYPAAEPSPSGQVPLVQSPAMPRAKLAPALVGPGEKSAPESLQRRSDPSGAPAAQSMLPLTSSAADQKQVELKLGEVEAKPSARGIEKKKGQDSQPRSDAYGVAGGGRGYGEGMGVGPSQWQRQELDFRAVPPASPAPTVPDITVDHLAAPAVESKSRVRELPMNVPQAQAYGGGGMGGMGGYGGMQSGEGEGEGTTQAGLPLEPGAAPEKNAPAGLRGPVQVETLEGLDTIILRGNKRDVETVRRRIQAMEGRMGRSGGIEAGQGLVGAYNDAMQRVQFGIAPNVLQQMTLGTEQYAPVVENPFLSPVTEPESTVSADVDTASYPNVRRFLENNQAPPPGAVRVEEMVNYFAYDYPQPKDETPFSVDMETASCPWNDSNRLVRIGLKAKEIDAAERGPSNIVFLLDVSGSMRDANKLPLVKDGMVMLVDQLTEDDRVSIVTYAGEAGLALEPTEGTRRKKILERIEALKAVGSTHGSAGIQMAYDQAMANFVPDGSNRVILCTDGDLNVGITDDNELVKLIKEKASSGVFLTVVGFGTGNLKDAKLEQLADKGNGNYAYVDGLEEAKKVFVEQVSGNLVTVAKDVKIQIEFNPAKVQSYRLIGYENRLLAAQDFDDDMKDAGEIGAGHSVTFFYEIVPTRLPVGQIAALNNARGNLRYQQIISNSLTEVAESGELLALKLRYKLPDEQESRLLEMPVMDSGKRFGEASSEFRFAAAVASFGMLLRGSQYNQGLTFSAVEEFAAGAADNDPEGRRGEFVDLVRRARTLYGDTTQVGADAMMLPDAAEVEPAAAPAPE